MNTDKAPEFILGPAGQLEVDIVFNGSKSHCAVICHPHPLHGGTMDNKVVTALAKSYQLSGMNTIRFNYRGVKKSEGNYGEGYGEADDLSAILKWLQHHDTKQTIHLAGFSFGTFVALQALQDHVNLIESVVLVAPPVHHFPFDFKVYPDRCLLIQSEDDEVVPPDAVFEWAESISNFYPKIERFKTAGHFFHGQLITLREKVLAWLADNVAD